ncbi:MAG: hypothetical protein V3U88_06935 [Methylococcales bacterium]
MRLQPLHRVELEGTELNQAQCGTIRLKPLKISVTVRKVWVTLSESYPYAVLLDTGAWQFAAFQPDALLA